MGAKFVTFPKFQTSASQTETLFPLSSPPPSISPFILRGRENALSTSRETPASSVLHPIAANPPRPPPSRRSRYPDVVVQRNRNRNALKDLAAEAEAELPPRCRHRRAPYQNHSDHAVLRLTAAAPLSQPSTAPELFPLRRLRRLGSASPPPTDGHRTTLNNLAMGSSKAAPSSTTSGFRRTTRRSSEKQKEDTALPAERGTPLPLFVQILRLRSHRIHPTKETS